MRRSARGEPIRQRRSHRRRLRRQRIAAILLGTQPTSVPMGKGGDLLVVPLITFLIPLPVGGTTLAEDIENDPALCGVEFFVQTLVADKGAAKKQSASAGLKLVLEY